MKKFIKLCVYDTPYSVYIDPKMIVSILWCEDDCGCYTQINMSWGNDSFYRVVETPEEIFKLIE